MHLADYKSTLSIRAVGIIALILGILGVVAVLHFAGMLDGHIAGGLALGGLVVGDPTKLAKELHDKRAAFQGWYTEQKSAGTLEASEFQKRNNELNELATQYEEAKGVSDAAAANDAAMAELKAPHGRKVPAGTDTSIGEPRFSGKTLGETFVESAEFKQFISGPRAAGSVSESVTVDVDKIYGKGRGFKTLFDTGTSFSIQNVRLPDPITPGAQQPTVASLMAEGRTSGNAILYMEETTTTSNAAETAESGTKPEAALAFTERTSNVRKIAVTLPVTDESLEDIPFIESYLDGRLSFFIVQREDSQLLVGSGSGSNLRGIVNVSGINTQAAGTDANQDAILKGIVLAETTGFFQVDAVVMNPANWQTMRLAKDDVGNYLFGPPNLPGADQVFGYRIVRTTAMTSGTAVAGAWRAGAGVYRRSDLAMQVGWINDQFVKNQRTILVEERLALVCFRPSAFTKITGLS